ncbi:MAG: asparaginase [Acidobacteria bacterium]|nr:asparaginase [Acidobacteriota bacterium]
MKRLVNVYRGDRVESFHSGSIAVVDATGRLVAYAGDPDTRTFLRSAAKPFQILPLLREGGRDEFDLTEEELALICASHGGEPFHVATAAAILRKGEFDESDLRCGPHMPYEERAAAELRLSGEGPSPLHNNCSGKHAGMLLYCEMLDLPTSSYLDRDHPLQIDIANVLSEFCRQEPDEIPTAIDGCSVPTFFLSLYRAALAYARLGATALGMDEPASIPEFVPHARAVLEAMSGHAEYVAGGHSITTPLMQSFDGDLLGKEGAEAFYGMLVLPSAGRSGSRPELFECGPLGVAIKVADGTAPRGRDPVILETLRQLGVDPGDKPLLRPYLDNRLLNAAGVEVGHVRAEFSLTVL